MAAIDPVYNGESGASVRDKLNELIDTVNSGSTTINVGDAPLFDPNKAGGYEAGSIVSYRNEASPDPEFHEFAIYLALFDIGQGIGPEDSSDWKNEGGTVEVAGGNTANGVVQNITRLRELTGMRTGHTVAVQAEGAIYVFDEGSETGVKPFAPGIGSWRKRGFLSFSNVARVFTQYDSAEGEEVFCPLLHTIINFAHDGNVTIADDNGNAALNIVFNGPCIVRRIAAPLVLSSFEITPLNTLIENLPQTAITGLVAKLIELEKSNPVRYVRFFRSTTEELFGETYYTSTEEEGTGAVLDISQAITGTDLATADQVAQFSGIPVPAGTEFTIRQLNVDILARKNATSRTVSMFAEFWNMDAAGALTQLGTSNVLTLSENSENKPLFFSLGSDYTPAEGSRAVIIFRAFQTGTGIAATATISIDDQTGSRWSFDTVIQADGGGHTILDPAGDTMPTQDALQFGAGFTVTDKTGKTVVEREAIDFDDITPDPAKGKKLAKVKDDGTGLDYTDYGYDEVVQKAQTFNEGTLKKFDVNGNDVDSGLTGESLDIYAISPSLINALTNESNWRDGGGNQIVGGVAFASGIKGQRYYSEEFFYECIADNNWVRTYTGRPVVNIYDNPALTLVFKGYLEDTLNWVGKIYTGPAITGVAQGTRHYDNDYVYEFFQTNVPIRYSRD